MTKKSADINYISKDLFPKTYNRTMIDDDYIKQLEQENNQLKCNWNKLKEWLKEYEEGTYGLGSYEAGLSDGLGDVIKKMQELQGSDSNE